MAYCKICNTLDCDKHAFVIGKIKKEFSGASPPEIFVGRWNYPNVYAGILSPEEHGDTSMLSSPESWHANRLSIPQILENRNRLIYGRSPVQIKGESKFISTMQEVAMTERSISAEFILKKPIEEHKEQDPRVPLIKNATEISQVNLQENPKIRPKVEYLVNDTDVKSANALIELDSSGIQTSTLAKILSAGLLGIKNNRKLVPTRWSITAVDDTLSKNKLTKIRLYTEISDIQVFSAEYLGNHYEFILLPDKWSFEVIEISMKNKGIWHDLELFSSRKHYADSVTGAYYANRLAVTEYLERVKKQASCIVLREVREEYTSPLGVGILRQVSREAFSKSPLKFSSIKEALDNIKPRLKIHIEEFVSKSTLIKDYGKQKRLDQFFF